MARAQAKPTLTTYHAVLHVTRAEQWCVEATSEEEARALLAAGLGHRCDAGERLHVDFDRFERE